MSCSSNGPGYKSPKEAMKGPKEKILYIPCIQLDKTKPDYIVTVDIDPQSPNYTQIIHRLKMPYLEDELHHTGWNACSSCFGCSSVVRDKLIVPCLNSDRVYVIDVSEKLVPKIHKIVEPEVLHSLDLSAPHTAHCLPSGEIMISTMGKADGSAKGDFLILDALNEFKAKGTWSDTKTPFGYDFWYQPFHNVMVSSEWGAPLAFKKGLDIEDVKNGMYGSTLSIWDWENRKMIQKIELGMEGVMPLELRFLHEPKECQGFVGCALASSIFRFHKKEDSWVADKVITIPPKKVEGWVMSEMPGVITDILISMDDKFLYMSNWLHGDVRQYDISNPAEPKLVGQLFIGGSITKDSGVKVVEDPELKEQPSKVEIKGTKISGAPQMLQLSLDGTRLYVTTSLFSPWDLQFYPDMKTTGSVLLQINVDTIKGGLSLNQDFLLDFSKEPDGPVLAHEIRYPGGDCTSDIYLA